MGPNLSWGRAALFGLLMPLAPGLCLPQGRAIAPGNLQQSVQLPDAPLALLGCSDQPTVLSEGVAGVGVDLVGTGIGPGALKGFNATNGAKLEIKAYESKLMADRRLEGLFKNPLDGRPRWPALATVPKIGDGLLEPCGLSPIGKPSAEQRDTDPKRIATTPGGLKLLRDKGTLLVGDIVRSRTCIEAISRLKPQGLTGSITPPQYNTAQKQAEANFDASCQSAPPENLARDVGVLVSGPAGPQQSVACTGLLLSRRFVLTARHCYFKDRSGASPMLDVTTAALSMRWYFWPVSGPARSYGVAALLLLTGTGGKAWTRFAVPAQVLRPIALTEEFRHHDFVLVLLDEPAHEPHQYEFDRTATGAQLIPVAAYAPAWRIGVDPSVSPLRTQDAGMCQVLEAQPGGCLLHGCALTGGASGAPLFVTETKPTGGKHTYLVGMHTSGSAAFAGCQSLEWGTNQGAPVNFGLTALKFYPFVSEEDAGK